MPWTLKRKDGLAFRILSSLIAFAFTASMILAPAPSLAKENIASILGLPAPGTMVARTEPFFPAMLKGLRIDPANPLRFDFIVDTGDSGLIGPALNEEASKLIRYFLAAVTVPEKELWVNLSPYEKDRIVPQTFGETEMGRDLLAQDYILKQFMASLIYPEDDLGKEFWSRVYARAKADYGTTDIPVNTFNKVWIVPEEAVVLEYQGSAFVTKSHLKVMLEGDYKALEESRNKGATAQEKAQGTRTQDTRVQEKVQAVDETARQVIREVLIPEIEQEVNTGRNFASLRQIYNSVILAIWYKQNLKNSLLGQVYADKGKIKGVDVEDKEVKQKIYEQYLQAFKTGVYNYIKEDYDPATKKEIPRKYFSGGTGFDRTSSALTVDRTNDFSALPGGIDKDSGPNTRLFQFTAGVVENGSKKWRQTLRSSSSLTQEEQAIFSAMVLDNINSGIIGTPEDLKALRILIEIGEQGLLATWDMPGVNDDKKKGFLEQILKYDANRPGGLKNYKQVAFEKLQIAKQGGNPMAGLTPAPADGDDFTDIESEKYIGAYQSGLKEMHKVVFAMPAGGVGARLGYKSGIKLSIPLDLVTMTSYIKHFVDHILALQIRSNRINNTEDKIPFVMMTSDDTHQATLNLLVNNNYFGMDGMSVVDPTKERVKYKDGRIVIESLDGKIEREELRQIVIFKQESVPATQGYEAKFMLDETDPYKLKVLPHNHGDIHILMWMSGVAQAFANAGKSHTVFFQDSNGDVFNAIVPGLGNMINRGDQVNFFTVKRHPGSNIGAIAKLTKEDGTSMTGNIEYNMLDSVLKATISPEGDMAGPDGYSKFPGNMNVFALEQKAYTEVLEKTHGLVGEIVNPKKDTLVGRLEAPMQDISLEFPGNNVGVTRFGARYVFNATKNDPQKARAASEKGIYPEFMATSEMEYYKNTRTKFHLAEVTINVAGQEKVVMGIPVNYGAVVKVSPLWGLTPEEMGKKVRNVEITDRSVVVLEGEHIQLIDVTIDGALIVKTGPMVSLTINGLKVENAGGRYVALTPGEMASQATPEYESMRFHKFYLEASKEINIQEPGSYEVAVDGRVRRTGDYAGPVESYLLGKATDATYRGQQSSAVTTLLGHIGKFSPSEGAAAPGLKKNVGGINLDPALLNLQIKRDENWVPLPLPQQPPLEQMNIEGFYPVIINVTPIPSIPAFLGMGEGVAPGDETAGRDEEEGDLSYLSVSPADLKARFEREELAEVGG